MFHAVGFNGHARRTIACAFIPAFAALLMQCAHGQPGTGEQPPLLPQPPAAQTSVFADCDVCPEMVPLPEGDVALGRYEVTLEEYRAFAAAVPAAAEAPCGQLRRSWRSPGYLQTGRHPVACVSWNEAQVYAEWLSLRTGRQYRLPTEAEWDRGAAGSPAGCFGRGGTCVVGSFEPGDAGIFGMVGNLREWTDSCWDGDCGRRVTRGAHWRTWGRRRQRSDARAWAAPGHRDFRTGFRVARTLPDWTHPQDLDEKITKKAEYPVDLDTGAVGGVTVQDADAGDTTTMAETLVTAAEQVDHVFVEVLDQAGRPVSDLTAADFSFQENNVDLDSRVGASWHAAPDENRAARRQRRPHRRDSRAGRVAGRPGRLPAHAAAAARGLPLHYPGLG